MKWEKQTPIDNPYKGCWCSTADKVLHFGRGIRIAVGFGFAALTKNSEVIWQEDSSKEYDECMLYDEAEAMAAADPDNDWRIHLEAPLSENHYQRQGEKCWVLYKTGEGFA